MPQPGPTLCHPKIGYVDPSVSPLSTHKLPIHRWSTLMEITHTLPQITDTKFTVTSNVQFLQLHNLSSKMQKTQSLTRPATHAAISTSRYAISSPTLTSLNSTSLAAPKANHIQCCKCCVVKEKFCHSFVLPKKYSVREINNFPKRYKMKTRKSSQTFLSS